MRRTVNSFLHPPAFMKMQNPQFSSSSLSFSSFPSAHAHRSNSEIFYEWQALRSPIHNFRAKGMVGQEVRAQR